MYMHIHIYLHLYILNFCDIIFLNQNEKKNLKLEEKKNNKLMT